jgi:Na+-driven multidrug efflux pump
MKDIKTGTICSIISMVSVAIMFLWGFFGNGWNVSWVAVMIGGMLSGIVYMIRRDKEKGNDDNK